MTLAQATEGFQSLRQFMAALRASATRGIPFADLKKAMVGNGISLGQSVRQLQALAPTTQAGASGFGARRQGAVGASAQQKGINLRGDADSGRSGGTTASGAAKRGTPPADAQVARTPASTGSNGAGARITGSSSGANVPTTTSGTDVRRGTDTGTAATSNTGVSLSSR